MLPYQLAVASRAIAAILGCYGLASAAAACLAVWLLARADAVVTAQMLSFVFYACGVIWVFATRNAWRAWAGILIPRSRWACCIWRAASRWRHEAGGRKQQGQEGLRQAMSWLHTWSGLIFGWALFAMFLTGTLAFFRPEITRWMQPRSRSAAPAQQAVATAQRYLSEHAVDAKRWFITPPTDREPLILLLYQTPKPKPGERGFVRVKLDPQTGQAVTARETRGGDFFYRFHSSWRSAFPGDAGWPASRACSCWWPSSAASSRTRRSSLTFSPSVRRRADSAPGWTGTTRCPCWACHST